MGRQFVRYVPFLFKVRNWILTVAGLHKTCDEDLSAQFISQETFRNGNVSLLQRSLSCPPGASTTWTFLATLHTKLHRANEKTCAAAPLCTSQKSDMVYCVGWKCRDWYHLKCCGETRRLNTLPKLYRCPKCLSKSYS